MDATTISMQLPQISINWHLKVSNSKMLFASAPVCSPSRSCLIQGALPPSMGTQHMRSGFSLPSFIGFPALLRKNGYYTTNNVKTDYNSGNYQQIIEKSWNESSSTAHWRKRSDRKDAILLCLQPDDLSSKSLHGMVTRKI